MKYAHLLTFELSRGKKVMHVLNTVDTYPTAAEWNDFTEQIFGANREWVLIHSITMHNI